MTETRERTFEVEPGEFLRADGQRADGLEGAESYTFRAAVFSCG